jgi:hypothetical protein
LKAVFFGLGLLFSALGGWLVYWAWSAYQELQAAYLRCEANHPPNAPYSCQSIFNGGGGQLVALLGTLLILSGIGMILLGFVRISLERGRN